MIIYGFYAYNTVCVHLLVCGEEKFKSIGKEMAMVGVHKTSSKKDIYVENLKDI